MLRRPNRREDRSEEMQTHCDFGYMHVLCRFGCHSAGRLHVVT